MAVTVISRPVGHKLSTTEIDALIYDNGGDAVVYVPGGHTLSDGDYVFIESNFDAYNGFKYVDSIAYDQFKIRESEGGDYVPFKQAADILLFISELDHGFQCVHLPIVYELSSDLWPNNEYEDTYTPISVVSFEDNNGYTQINLDIALSNPVVLNYIKLVGTGELAGPYQIIQVVNSWSLVINLAYDAGNDLSLYTVQNYYNNYFITVKVYGGFDIDHTWYSEKPYELLGTLKFIPDSTGNVKFSISQILKGQIETRNNLTLDTLPNNLDFATKFYITYFETYDQSDGTDISSVDGNINSDKANFEGTAVNSILPFKTLNQGHLSDYIASDSTPGRWLHTQDRPIAIVGYFFDLSFINQYSGLDINVTIYKSLNDLVTETEIIEIINPGEGVLRVPLTIESGFDQYCAQASTLGSPGTPGNIDVIVLDVPNDWTSRNIDPFLVNWTTSPRSVNLGSVSAWDESSEQLYQDYAFIAGKMYSITLNLTRIESGAGSILTKFATLSITDSAFNTQVSNTIVTSASYSITIEFMATADTTKIVLSIHDTGQANSFSSTTFVSSDATEETIEIPAIPAISLTEQICIDIVDDCDTFINDNLRLTEGGQFRELE